MHEGDEVFLSRCVRPAAPGVPRLQVPGARHLCLRQLCASRELCMECSAMTALTEAYLIVIMGEGMRNGSRTKRLAAGGEFLSRDLGVRL